MLKKAGLLATLLVCVSATYAQTTFLPLGSEGYNVLDRLETRSGRFCDSLALGDKPETRRNAVNFLQTILAGNSDTTATANSLSLTDRYNIQQMISESGEWAAPKGDGAIDSRHPWLRSFYKKQYDFLYVKTEDFSLDKDFFLVINPVTNNVAGLQMNSPAPAGISKSVFYTSRGAELRGWISKKVGFYTSLTDNQEQYPYYVLNKVEGINGKHLAVPGGDYFLKPAAKNGYYDYMQLNAYINFDAVKNHVNFTFGQGKHFIGDGISSLFLTDQSSNMPYMQIQARIWKLNYESLYLELTPQYDNTVGDAVLWHKYATMHYLTWNASKWLNLGFFESEVFDRPNTYEISYLNPIIFSTAINRFNGSGDKSLLGFSFKALAAKHFQFYGQFMLNEFKVKEFTGGRGWYGNKYGVQAGGKYFDAFGIRNLDLQGEVDAVRPYTYSAQDTFDNYTNYNQPLADPLGSGFVKAIGTIKYQPVKNLYLSLYTTYYIKGVDTGDANYGNNLLNTYPTAINKYGVKMINGPRSTCQLVNLNISYQVFRNVFLDLGGTYRKYINAPGIYPNYSATGTDTGPLTTSYIYFGFRVNASRRDYNFM